MLLRLFHPVAPLLDTVPHLFSLSKKRFKNGIVGFPGSENRSNGNQSISASSVISEVKLLTGPSNSLCFQIWG